MTTCTACLTPLEDDEALEVPGEPGRYCDRDAYRLTGEEPI